MNKYIYYNDNSISKELCNEIIHLYELEPNTETHVGRIFSGIDITVKNSIDFTIPNNEKWNNVYKFLRIELLENLKKYLLQLNNKLNNVYKNEILSKDLLACENYDYFNLSDLHFEGFIIKKYLQKEGKYIYHNDFGIDYINKKYRIITFLWYLNDVEEGGETVIEDIIYITPNAGKLILFPSSWTFPHTGKVPISSNKYIITGWIYLNILIKN
jgi:hypothetical protein